ncbi:TM0106 family RecB-like putative nuclease [Arthrobacter crystallopoietes]|nr:TM0106 family RecB-like putative nuclease [Arthrobacter crystallopoietes]
MFTLPSTDASNGLDVVFSASDLVLFSTCQFATLRRLDIALKWSPKPDFAIDAMLDRTSRLGDTHEKKVLVRYVNQFGRWNPAKGTGVYIVEEVTAAERSQGVREAYIRKHDETVDALRAGADVVFQASFFDGVFHGKADFLVKQPNGAYAVYDTKLARHPKTTALLQLASYADQLLKLGFQVAPEVTLVLGTLEESNHAVVDLLPVYREQFGRLLKMASGHRSAGLPVEWFGENFSVCGTCDYCSEAIEANDDLFCIAGMRTSRRQELMAQGISTVKDLALADPAQGDAYFARLVDQAVMQAGADSEECPKYKVLPGHNLHSIPRPSEGDIFFDFEGDPLWQDTATGDWGIEYLFGVIEAPVDGLEPVFVKFVAHDRKQERQAFLDFVDYVQKRRAQHPDMHIYHYAAYERTALKRLSHTYPGGEHAIDDWLRNNVLVDLYAVVRRSLRIAATSYSIKKLEPLYMGDELRTGDVKDAGASVVAYEEFCDAIISKNQQAADRIWRSIEDYNHYDCLSTLRLRDWLQSLRHPDVSGAAEEGSDPRPLTEPSELEVAMGDLVAALPDESEWSGEDIVLTLVEAALAYHRRENNTAFREHFDRLNDDVEDWQDHRDVFLIEECTVEADWARKSARLYPRRRIRASGRLADGSRFIPTSLKKDARYVRIFEDPWPAKLSADESQMRNLRGHFRNTEIISVDLGENGQSTIIFDEVDKEGYEQFPMALAPRMPVPADKLKDAIHGLARRLLETYPELPRHCVFELLRRRSPNNLFANALAGVAGHDYVSAAVRALKRIDHSYVAVQGPPGTGKTYVGARVIKALVEQGWRIGVVAQSHAVVENLLDSVVEAGLSNDCVGKVPEGDGVRLWTTLAKGNSFRDFAKKASGVVVGGTAWTFTDPALDVEFDLMVVDEAGQYSLAYTMAAAHNSRRLLLLGDPNQLPQVTQGKHPAPVNRSALGWLTQEKPVLPSEFGYFLDQSWRMHPELCNFVSRLSYGGRLSSADAASQRNMEREPAGVETLFVDHENRTTSSSEEADEVVRQVRRHVGLAWVDEEGVVPRPLAASDVLVVAAYNAQVELLRRVLDNAGLEAARVGTVDKFQGQEAPVVVVSMACSEPRTAARGMEFLLNRNRINVAVSRAKWRTVLIRSPHLTHYLPKQPHALAELGAFIGLSEGH